MFNGIFLGQKYGTSMEFLDRYVDGIKTVIYEGTGLGYLVWSSEIS